MVFIFAGSIIQNLERFLESRKALNKDIFTVKLFQLKYIHVIQALVFSA